MRDELILILKDVTEYIINASLKVKPILTLLWSGITFIIFPDNAYIPSALSVGGAILLDIITKYYAIARPYNSLYEALRVGAISSETFYEGTKKKLISFLVLMILCGLAVRVVPIHQIAVFSGTFVYTIMFLRECQSIVENLLQAGHDDVGWLLPILQRKEKRVLKELIDKEEATEEEVTEEEVVERENKTGEDDTHVS